MIVSKDTEINQDFNTEDSNLTASQKRRIRRKKLHAAKAVPESGSDEKIDIIYIDFAKKPEVAKLTLNDNQDKGNVLKVDPILDFIKLNTEMSSKQVSQMRDDVIAAREAKKLAKQKVKNNNLPETTAVMDTAVKVEIVKKGSPVKAKPHNKSPNKEEPSKTPPKPDPGPKVEEIKKVEVTSETKSKDEVDRAIVKNEVGISECEKAKDQVKAERAAKKAAKQAKKKGAADENHPVTDSNINKDITVKDVVNTLNDIVNVAKEVQEVTAKVNAIDLEAKKPEESKSKAELKAERRAKQEAQRAAKQAAQEKTMPPKTEPSVKPKEPIKSTEEKSPKQKPIEKSKKPQSGHRVNWFQHLYNEHDKESLKKIAINSNLHPAIVKLGVQLASRVVTGSNARCIALLDALKKMVRDYTLPAKTEFARGLESHLASSVEYLWSMRHPSASQTNAVKYFRHHLTQLPNNVDEFDAKKTLQEEIDTYIREQIDKAGEAISIAVRNKISNGDNILTYGCSSLIERILREAWEAGVQFRAVVVGQRVNPAAKEMLRRLVDSHVPCSYMDITALSFAMNNINKVLLGASSVLVNGSVLCGAGAAQTALLARARNVPVLVACETHKFADNVHTDAFVYSEIGDPDDLIDHSDENSPLKDWRSNPNLTPLNLTYDITPPNLVTAVVTELAILPCTSAPVVLRFKLSEYGI